MPCGATGLYLNVRLVEGDPCGVLDDLLAGSYDPNDPLQMAATDGTSSAQLAGPWRALVPMFCLLLPRAVR